MDKTWHDTLASTGKALFDDVHGIRSTDPDELWEVYLTFLAQKRHTPEISRDEFVRILAPTQ